MNGAVLLIGSLLWENEENSLDKTMGKIRVDWRKELDVENKIQVNVPIRYGRVSSTKMNTYTMVFSNSVYNFGTAYIVPFKNVSNNFTDIKNQALRLSIAEGISTQKYPNRLISTWGAVGITFNNVSEIIKNSWHNEFKKFDNQKYGLGNETPTIKPNGELNFYFKIPNDIDYVFATTIQPNVLKYPTDKEIINIINETKYDTYIKENFNNGIRVDNDDYIIKNIW
jgi:hypothetical protein